MSTKDSDLMYVYIPKNASSWTKPNLLDWSWQIYNYHTDNLYHKHALIVLRDPIERWISGISEYIFLYHRNLDVLHCNESFFDLIFDRVAFDDHTDLQVLFLQNLDFNNATFFWCDHQYRNKFSTFLNRHGMKNNYFNYDFQHVSNNDPFRKKIKEIFSSAIENNKTYKDKLKWYFDKDYNLINSVTFYAG